MIYVVVIDGEIIETTAEHPFYTDDERWVQAAYLDVGEQVLALNGDYGTVEDVQAVDAPQPMYNLTVDEAHTFFVGDGQWLVHNTCNLRPYGEVGGHHLHAKRAFTDNPNYNQNAALAIGDADLTINNWNHSRITQTQRRLFSQLNTDVINGTRNNSLAEHSEIAYQALAQNGVPSADARVYVAQSESWLIQQGITQPICIPWNTC